MTKWAKGFVIAFCSLVPLIAFHVPKLGEIRVPNIFRVISKRCTSAWDASRERKIWVQCYQQPDLNLEKLSGKRKSYPCAMPSPLCVVGLITNIIDGEIECIFGFKPCKFEDCISFSFLEPNKTLLTLSDNLYWLISLLPYTLSHTVACSMDRTQDKRRDKTRWMNRAILDISLQMA